MEFQFRADREAHLRKLCEEMEKSVDEFINEAVLTSMEDYEDGRDATAAFAEFEASGEKAMTLEAVVERYGLERSDLAESSETAGSSGQSGAESHPQLPAGKATRAA